MFRISKRTYFIVYEHKGEHYCIRVYGLKEVFIPYVAKFVYRKVGYIIALFSKHFYRLKDRCMFKTGGNYLITIAFSGRCPHNYSLIVRFSTTGGKDNLTFLCLQGLCYPLPCFFHISFCFKAFYMLR